MKILLVYSSRTGNTKKVAEAIGEELGITPVPVEEMPDAAGCDLVLAGFWVDRGTADAKMKAYLEGLQGTRIAMFATLGAGPATEHAQHCLESAVALPPAGNEVVGQFICQGKIDETVLQMMAKKFLAGHPHALSPVWTQRVAAAASHPDADDLAAARDYFRHLVDLLERD